MRTGAFMVTTSLFDLLVPKFIVLGDSFRLFQALYWRFICHAVLTTAELADFREKLLIAIATPAFRGKGA